MTVTSHKKSLLRKTKAQMQIIDRIKYMRNERGYSQPMLADLIDVTNGQIGNIESQRQPQRYSLSQLKKICDEFHYSITELFTSNPDSSCDNLVEAIIQYEEPCKVREVESGYIVNDEPTTRNHRN